MRIGQIRWNNQVMAAIFGTGGARPIPDHTLFDLLARAEVEKVSLEEMALSQASAQHVQAPPIIPIHPREVWACGSTYRTNVEYRDTVSGSGKKIYSQVFASERPYLSFKGTARVCVRTSVSGPTPS
jgi:2-dehydro-3-deoxy-D-arabinonate dehydratase